MKLHSRLGRPRKDARTGALAVRVYCPDPPAPNEPLSPEAAYHLLNSAEIQDKTDVVARICRQVAEFGTSRKNS